MRRQGMPRRRRRTLRRAGRGSRVRSPGGSSGGLRDQPREQVSEMRQDHRVAVAVRDETGVDRADAWSSAWSGIPMRRPRHTEPAVSPRSSARRGPRASAKMRSRRLPSRLRLAVEGGEEHAEVARGRSLACRRRRSRPSPSRASLPRPWRGGRKHEPADQSGTLERDLLGDEAADREAEEVDLGESSASRKTIASCAICAMCSESGRSCRPRRCCRTSAPAG